LFKGRHKLHNGIDNLTLFARRTVLASLAAGSLSLIRLPYASAANLDRYAAAAAVTADDIAWFRKCRAVWIESEAGAPAVVPGELSFQDLAEFGDSRRPAGPYERLERVLCAFFLHARFEAGHYPLNPRIAHSEAFAGAPDAAAFAVSPDHVRLFRHTNWRASFIDTKRPYGDYQYYEKEMAEILGLAVPKSSGERLPAATETRFRSLHRDMLFVLQAYLQHAGLSPGHYQIPFDGWDTRIDPLCEPVSQARLDAYVRAMDQLRQQTFPNDPAKIVPRFKAASILFGND
jgi:hypothetical protein